MKFVFEQIAKPLLRRIGVLVAGWLAAQGIPQETIDIIVNGLIAFGLVGLDLALSYRNRVGG